MKTGTFLCWLFGHKFHGERLEYHPHYLKLVEQGLVSTLMRDADVHMIGFQTSYCVRCGADRVEEEK